MNKLFLLLALLLVTIPVTASAQVPQAPALTAKQSTLVFRDSDNAHQVARLALDAIGCMITATEEGNDWTAEQCVATLRGVLQDYGQEHRLLHPKVEEIFKAGKTQRSS